jgi:hypothetical protein
MAQCERIIESTGERCRGLAVTGRPFCYHHDDTGSRTQHGFAHPAFKHGKYSRDLPSRLLSRYEQSIADPELAAMTHEIGVLDARIGELLNRIDKGEAGALWSQLTQMSTEAAAYAASDTADGLILAGGLWAEMAKLIKRGASEWKAWDSVVNLMEERRKIVDTETKRKERERRSMDYKQAIILVSTIRQIIFEEAQRYVLDAAIRRAFISGVATAFERLVAQSARGGIEADAGDVAGGVQELGDTQELLLPSSSGS